MRRITIIIYSLLFAFHSNAEYWGPLDENRIKTIASYLDASPKGFGEPITNRAAWNALKANPSYSGLIGNANQYLTMAFPAWSDAAYLDYSKTGKRPLGETMINNRHRWLAPVVWAECLEGNGRFLPVIKKILAEYVSEPTWVLPAHDDGLNNFYKRSYTVDLSSSKFGFEIAQTLYLLGDRIGTDLYKQVYNELNARIFNSVLTSLTTYKGNDWLLRTNNWNVVCLAGVTGAALAVVPDKNVRARFIVASEKYSKNYMDGFLADGYDPEGIGYNGYSMTNFITLREVVYQSTKKNVDFFTNPKVKLMALYGPKLMIQNNVWPTIADCRWATTAADNVMWYVGRVFGIKLGAKYDTKSSFVATSDISVGCMHAFPNSASLSPNPTTVNLIGIRTYFPNAGVVVVRPSTTATAIGAAYNAGNNNESHNHNDIGSYTVVAGNQSMAGDPGGPTFYNGDVWGSARYTKYKQFSSYGHPLPIIGGATQIGGAAAVGTILGNKFSDALDVTEMDIKKAYNIPELTSLLRKFYFSRNGSGTFTVVDSFQFTKPMTFETAIPTHSAVQEISSNILKFTSNGQVLYALIEAGNNPFVYTYDYINELGLQFTRVGVKLTNPISKGVVKITYSIDHPTPAASITSSTTSFCKGGSIQLNASSGTGYRWFKESLLVGTSATYNAKTSGAYTAEVTYSNGTKSISPVKVISELSVPIATITTSGTTTFCNGGSVNLTSSTGSTYVWRNGTTSVATTSNYVAKTAGAYTVIVANANGCKDTSVAKVVTVNPVPTINITSPANNATWTTDVFQINATVTGTNISNVSFYNGTSLLGTDITSPYGITKPSLANGTYTLSAIAKNTFNCTDTSKVTVKVNKVITAMEEDSEENNKLSVSPNPFQHHFTIEKVGLFEYSITDSKGVLVESGKAENAKMMGENLSQGLYFISISNTKGTKRISAIKQ